VGFEAGQLGERHDVERLWKEKQTEDCGSGMVAEKCESKEWQNMIARVPYLTGATKTVQGGCEGPCKCGGWGGGGGGEKAEARALTTGRYFQRVHVER
jgi:hypothetical protein